MHIMYVDESGDPGVHQFSSPHFILSGLVLNQEDWSSCLARLKEFRKYLKVRYQLNQRTEVHTSELFRVNKLEEYRNIRKSDRISILKDYCAHIPIIFDKAKIINVCFDKRSLSPGTNVQERAWSRLIGRYDTFLKRSAKDKGIIIADDTDAHVIQQLLRKLRIYNPVTSHFTGTYYDTPTDSIIEDVFYRNSIHSYFIQSVDVVAHILYRKEYPKGSLKKYGVEHLFNRLAPILLNEAAKNDPYGIVRK